MIIDTHAHLNDPAFRDDLEAVVARAKKSGVVHVVNAADTLASIEKISALAQFDRGFFRSAYGVMPNELEEVDLSALEALIALHQTGLVAIGEIGLDYHYGRSERIEAEQKKGFIAQIEIAKKLGLPIVVHSRDADQDTFDLLTAHAAQMKVDLHCYSGSAELAKEYLKHIPQISFGVGGVLTFKNARRLLEVVISVPLDHLVLETDAPYLAPTPMRGQRNEPAYLPQVVEKLAELRGTDVKEIEEATYHNAKRLFGI